ncbi:MarR family winged helix-turn-helix transcriptional regulator [Timonella senegalensis]|uniref:MarR family winged helix-turn-helix transcriptional regulator n=1 Tax=Timonella senegalensis TaxID=1465825 RepID=UPI0002FBF8F6|nr:MarR family transcriptional regulator [Timonella senegalensis]
MSSSAHTSHTPGTAHTSESTELRLLPEKDLVAVARQEIASVPVNDSATTAAFIERFERIRLVLDGLNHGLEQFTSIKTSQHLVLQALSRGVTHPRHIGKQIGMDVAAVQVTVEKLEEKGLVSIDERQGSRIIEVTLTHAGEAALSQAEAVQFRALDAILQQISTEDLERLITLLDEADSITSRLLNALVRQQG